MPRFFSLAAKLLIALTFGSAVLAAAPAVANPVTDQERQQRREQRAAQRQERLIQRNQAAQPVPVPGTPQAVLPVQPAAATPPAGYQQQRWVGPPVAPAPPVAAPAIPPGRLSPEERRELRRQIHEHGRDLYGERRR